MRKHGWIAAIGIGVLTVTGLTWADGPTPTTGPTTKIPGAAGIAARDAPTLVPTRKIPRRAPLQVPRPDGLPRWPPVRVCPDPKAMALTFTRLSRDPGYSSRGRIRVAGRVQNVGNAAFVSDPLQAIIYLSVVHQGVRLPDVKAQRNLARLDPGATVGLSFETDWDISSEFPPTISLHIGYDPDIYIDGNPNNDDCNQRNNETELTGETIRSSWSDYTVE